MADCAHPHPGVDEAAYAARLATEKNIYQDCLDVHNLPEIFHYWSNRYVRPKLEAFGFSTPDEMFRKYAAEQCGRDPDSGKRIVSVGAGNCQVEIDLARHLRAAGWDDFTIDCLELNPAMLERGRSAAAKEGIAGRLNFLQADLNEWDAAQEYDVAMANQTLHHVVNLERLFGQIRRALKPGGRFLISDMIGRNGHQRWPEALGIVQEFWRRLPPTYRFNRQMGRYEERFDNWDCSSEGFEGIRAQDILPLLIGQFQFELFVAYANVIDPFVDRTFGGNFDPSAAWDRSFIDEVHERDEAGILSGRLSPTHMLAVVGNDPSISLRCREPLTPRFCLRDPARAAVSTAMPDAYDWGAWPHSDRSQLAFVCRKLAESEERAKGGETVIADRTAWALRLDREVTELGQKVEELQEELKGRTAWLRRVERELRERTDWALQLDQEVNDRTAWARRLEEELKERTAWALQLDQENEKQAARAAGMARELEQLAWARALDRRFHRLLDGVFRMVRRVMGRIRARAD